MFALLAAAMGMACAMTSRSGRSIAVLAALVAAVEAYALGQGGQDALRVLAVLVLSQIALQGAYAVTVIAGAILRPNRQPAPR